LQIIEEGQGKLSINAVPHIIIPMSEQIDQFFAPKWVKRLALKWKLVEPELSIA